MRTYMNICVARMKYPIELPINVGKTIGLQINMPTENCKILLIFFCTKHKTFIRENSSKQHLNQYKYS